MADFTADKITPVCQFTFEAEGAWPMAVAFVGEDRVVAGNQNGELYLWRLPDAPPGDKPKSGDKLPPGPPPTRKFEGHANGVARLVALPDGERFVSASLDHSLRVWNVSAAAARQEFAILDAEFRRSEYKRTKKQEVLDQPGVEVEVQTDCQVLAGHGDWVQSLALSRDGRRLVSGDDGGHVIAWNTADWKVVSRWQGHKWNWITAVAISPDGEFAPVAEYRYKRDDFDIPAAGLKTWRVADGQEHLDILKTQFPKLDAAQNSYGSAQLWRKFMANGLVAADVSPDGKLLAVAQGGETDTGQAHLIELETGKLARSVASHQYGLTDLRFSGDGKHLFTCGRDTTVKITAVADGKQAAQIGAPRGGQFKDWFSALALSPSERYLAAADIEGSIRVWKIQ